MDVWLHRRIGVCLLVAFAAAAAVAAEAASLKDVEKYARECRGGKQDSCRRLTQIALTEKDIDVREAAIRQISDQATLANIARRVTVLAFDPNTRRVWIDPNEKRIALAAVETLTDESRLHELALQVTSEVLSRAAMGRLSQPALREIVLTYGEYSQVSRQALEFLDEDELVTLMTSAKFEGDRKSVLARIQSEPALATVASSSVSDYAKAAAERLTDQTLLRQVAQTARWGLAAIVAVEKLDDQLVVRELALDPRAPGRLAAIARLDDQETLTRIALESRDRESRARAVSRLTDQVLLRQLALESPDPESRVRAVSRLTDQALLRQLAFESGERPVRLAAAAALVDQASLAEVVVRHGEDRELVWAATERLSDRAAAGKVYGTTADAAIKQGRAYDARGDAARDEARVSSLLRQDTKEVLEREAFFYGMAMKAYSHSIALERGNAAAYGLRAVTRTKRDRDLTKRLVLIQSDINSSAPIPIAEFWPESLADADEAVALAPADARSYFARATVRHIQILTQWGAYRQVPVNLQNNKMAESLKPDLRFVDLAAQDLKHVLTIDPKHCEAFATLGEVMTIRALLAPNGDMGELPIRPANCKP